MFKNMLMAALVSGASLFAINSTAYALILTPADMIAANIGPANCEPGCIYDTFGLTNDGSLVLHYKADVGGSDSGAFASSYDTTFANSSSDPADALIDYTSGSAISCPSCYLAVKDGNQDPSYYFYNLSAWNGTDDLDLTGFWPNRGAISHVSIWGVAGSLSCGGTTGTPCTVPEPESIALLGLGMLGLFAARRRVGAK